jgi:hypothetical protein
VRVGVLHLRKRLPWHMVTVCGGGREQFPGRSSGRSGESLLWHEAGRDDERLTNHLSNKSSKRIDIFLFALPHEHVLVGIV